MTSYKKEYEVYERSSDGLLKPATFPSGWPGCADERLYGPFETEELAAEAVVAKRDLYRQFIIVPVISYVEGDDLG